MPERLHVTAYDQIHSTDADVFAPKSPAALQQLVLDAYKSGRTITVRGGGMSLGQQSLGRTIVRVDAPAFQTIGAVVPVGDEYHLTCGAGAHWGDIVRTIAAQGYVPRTVVTTGDATIGGTSAVDGVSRMSAFVGKEGAQVVRFSMIDGRGQPLTVVRPADPKVDPPSELLACVAGFGAVGIMTEVTIKVAKAIAGQDVRPTVETRATRLMPGTYLWSDLLRSIADDSRRLGADYHAYHTRPPLVAKGQRPVRGPVMGLSVVAWPAGGGLAVDRLEHRYVLGESLPAIPGGLYTANDWDARVGEEIAGYSDTLTELVSTAAFPNGYYVDDLCGFLFFLGNNATPAIRAVRSSGGRLNYVQQTFVLPAPKTRASVIDTEPTHRFVDAVQARAKERALRPFSIDFLYLPSDDAYLSATNNLEGYAVTITFADHDARQWPLIREMFEALSRDTLELGGRVHLVKNVEADPWVLRQMYADGLVAFRAVKARLDPRNILRNDFYDRYFADRPTS